MTRCGYWRPTILDEVKLDRHAVIEADAGTGKTYVIEHLIIELLVAGACLFEQILVVTFTEKATAELRARTRTRIEKIVAGLADTADPKTHRWRDLDGAALERLRNALFNFDRVSIFTIHSFCQRVLTDFAFQSRARLGLELIDSRLAFHRAFREALREKFAVAPHPLLERWLAESGDAPSRDSVIGNLEKLLFAAHFNRYLAIGEDVRNRRALDALVCGIDSSALKDEYRRGYTKVPAKTMPAADEIGARVRGARGDTDKLVKALSDFDFGPHDNAITKAGEPKGSLCALIDAARIAASLEVQVVEEFLPPIVERMTADKADRGVFDYDDMLAMVAQALKNDGSGVLSKSIRERWQCALVDEFQDTDDLQWEIFEQVFAKSEGVCRLFVVGDPKQAIYGFRGADVFTYLNARDALEGLGTKRVPLRTNFRATDDLVSSLNLIFEPVEGGIFDGEIRCERPAECGRKTLTALDSGAQPVTPVTLLDLRHSSENVRAARARAAIGRAIARELRDILVEGERKILIRETGHDDKPVKPDNVFILTRTKFESVEVGGFLREAGVPFAFYKQEGLFATPEASDILDVLRAIEEPDSQSRRLKAWASPIFAVKFEDLSRAKDLPEQHFLSDRLYEWKALAEKERFADLFDRILHQSGLAARELMFSNGERELINYQHLLDILLHEAVSQRLSLSEVVARLASWISGVVAPPGREGDVQPVESGRPAVQIMTMHMSKGLEADVVFVYGGLFPPKTNKDVFVYHEGRRRRLAVGGLAGRISGDAIDAEERLENQRLTYVALTRARAKLYLPLYPEKLGTRTPTGFYAQLNKRLTTLVSDERSEPLFEIRDINEPGASNDDYEARVSELIGTWDPPANLLVEEDDEPGKFLAMRRAHRAMTTASYTSLTSRRSFEPDDENLELKQDLASEVVPADLPGGRSVGVFLHEVIEKLDLNAISEARDLQSWIAKEGVAALFEETMRRRQVRDLRWRERGAEVVFNALRSSLTVGNSERLPALCRCLSAREMDFVYPIPERTHRLLRDAGGVDWTVERGYLKGVVDFVFEHGNRMWFADWKSDHLNDYSTATLKAHVDAHYGLQAFIYTIGIVRLMRIRDESEYNSRFGGLLYIFLRGVRPEGDGTSGVYFHRPAWNELVESEKKLVTSEYGDVA